MDILELKPDMAFLDIGCGTGWAVKYAYDKIYGRGNFIGIDISENMISIAREKYTGIQAIEFIKSSAENIDLLPDSVDRNICTNSFHHYPNPVKVLETVKRILKPNGILCIADVTTDSFFPKLLNMILKSTEMGHISFYSSNQYKEMFGKVGLKFKETQDFNSPIKIHICQKI